MTPRTGTERIHDGSREAREQRRAERAHQRAHNDPPRAPSGEPSKVREFIDRLSGHGNTNQR